VVGHAGPSWFILHPSAFIFIKRHAKINEDSKPKPTPRRHIRVGFNSDLDFSDIECLWRHKPVQEEASFESAFR
jgi:hypothetical protein